MAVKRGDEWEAGLDSSTEGCPSDRRETSNGSRPARADFLRFQHFLRYARKLALTVDTRSLQIIL